MVATAAVRSLIREDKIHQIYSVIQTGHKVGMKTMNQALFELYQAKKITYEEAMACTVDPDDLQRVFQRVR
jgi:twitching motility protein PilT